jgi:hypothetical protein
MFRAMAAQQHLSVSDSARRFAMSYAPLADGFIGCLNAKYTYSFWRPVTAIQNGNIDGNSDTVADPNWFPLATTPNHPEYPAAHGCATGALAETLAAFYGMSNVPISVNSAITGTTHFLPSAIGKWT